MADTRVALSCLLAIPLLATGVSRSEAQAPAGSLEQLRSQVRIGDTVTVTDITGRETRGRIADLSPSSLALTAGDGTTAFSEADVQTVSRRDSRLNGTLWGLATGAILGAALEGSLADYYGRDDVGYGSAVLPAAAVGAGLGFVVDALIKGRHVLYAKSSMEAPTLTVAPLWSAGRYGIAVSVRPAR